MWENQPGPPDDSQMDESTENTSMGGRPSRTCVGKGIQRLGHLVDHTKKKKEITPKSTGSGVSFFAPLELDERQDPPAANRPHSPIILEGAAVTSHRATSQAGWSSTSSSIRRRLEAEREAKKKHAGLDREHRALELQHQQLVLQHKQITIQEEKDLVNMDLEIEKAAIDEDDCSEDERSQGIVKGLSDAESEAISNFEKECRSTLPAPHKAAIEKQDKIVALTLQREEMAGSSQDGMLEKDLFDPCQYKKWKDDEIKAIIKRQPTNFDFTRPIPQPPPKQPIVTETDGTAPDPSGDSDESEDEDGPPPPPDPDPSGDQTTDTSPPTNNGNSDLATFANVIAQAINNISTQRPSNDKFLARQVQGRDLPPFYGRPEEWPLFISAFDSTTAACEYTDADNLIRLQKCLKSDALKTVQPLLVEPKNVPAVINKLKIRFGDPDRIIRSLVLKVKEIPPVRDNRLDLLVDLGTAVDTLVATINALNCKQHFNNPQLLEEVTEKLPSNFKMNWGRWYAANKLEKNLESFAKWMETETTLAASFLPMKISSDDKKSTHPRKPQNVLATSDFPFNSKKEKKCSFCSGQGHRLQQCKNFCELEIPLRSKWVKDNRACFSCLNLGHSTKDCRTKKPCPVDDCGRNHHRLLHRVAPAPHPPPDRDEPQPAAVMDDDWQDRELHIGQGDGQALLNIIPIKLRGPKSTIDTFALLDQGSAYTMMKKEIAMFLGLEGEKKPFKYCWINNDIVEACDSHIVQVDIIGPNKKSYHMTHVRTVDNLKLSRKSVKSSLIMKWKHLRNLDIVPFMDGVPTILIGQPHADLIVPLRRINGPPNAPIAAETKLGWVLNGIEPYVLETEVMPVLTLDQLGLDELHKLVKDNYSTESFGVDVTHKSMRSKDDEKAADYFHSTMKKIDGRYQVRLLWKDETIVLPESKPAALKRLYSIERKMDKNVSFAAKYVQNMNDYLDAGFIRKLTTEELQSTGPRLWYLPHFAVTKASKPDKIRLVFDAAAKANGMSLNDNLLKGPDEMNSLTSVLLKFRQRKVAFSADIKQMFHRLMIDPLDQPSQRLLWRGMDRTKQPEEFVMTVMTFGATCSPYCAQAAKNHNASEYADQFPAAADAIINKHYVDDYLDCTDTVDEALTRFEEVFQIHANGSFHICNWITNNKDLSSLIPEELRAKTQKYLDSSKDLWTERILGLFWDPSSDHFKFDTNFYRVPKTIVDGDRYPTKREALSLIMSIFDPLGFAGCLTIKAKILLQDVWRSKIDWDEEFPIYLHDKWTTWLGEMKTLNQIEVMRCYSDLFSSSQEVQLHIFCDASQSAYAAVAYFRISTTAGFETTLICSKTRVAPLKPLSIPRMELLAAVMGSRLSTIIHRDHTVPITRTFLWSDSTNVMDWIHSDGRKFQQFISHRVGEIQEKTDIHDWNWISTHNNVADEATRDNRPIDLTPNSRWLKGPLFLREPEENWPTRENPGVTDTNSLELRKDAVFIIREAEPPLIDINRFSKWSRLIGATATLNRIKNKLMKRDINKTNSSQDLAKAESMWCKWSQDEAFPSEMQLLTRGEAINSGPLTHLCLFQDSDGVTRVKGRIPNEMKIQHLDTNPIVLHSKHPYTALLIDHYHRQLGHHHQEQVVNELRQQFYIPGLRVAVRKCWNQCQHCRIQRANPKPPQIGMLPSVRIDCYVRPFTNTGLDYFGPYEVAIGRRREKRYGALFTCLTTRAIHLELAGSLSTDSCIMAIRRFIGRRGHPSIIWSDNGTNFVGANNELQQALQQLDQTQLDEEMTNRRIKWIYNAPLSAHMGGAWERMVRSVKVALSTTLKERSPKEDTLHTLLVEAEMIVNGHPLTYVPLNSEEDEALTPNHFLIGTSGSAQPPGEFDDKDLIPGRQWRVAQRLADHFWARWVREYLPTLTRKTKWNKIQENIKVGDVVIIADPNHPRNSWPKGLITQTFSKDGQVRIVDVKTATGTYRRPVHKLCILDVQPHSKSVTAPQKDEDQHGHHGGKDVAVTN